MSWRMMAIKRYFPFLAWLPELRRWPTLRADIIAGLTVAMLLIPQSMAYAHLAGLPVSVGLYAAFLPPIVAALFGSSRYLSTSPVPVTALLMALALQPLVAIGTPEYMQYVVLLTLLAGLIQLALGILRFGIVINFVSYPVILGFVNAVVIIIAGLQLANLLGVHAIAAPHYYQTIAQVLSDAVVSIHWPTVGLGAVAFVIMVGGRWLWPQLPVTLVAVVVTTVIAWLSGYEKLETISVNQIFNRPTQESLVHYQRYPQELKQLLAEIAKAKEDAETVMKISGSSSDATDEALNKVTQAQWQLDRQVARHNEETGELGRLRLRRVQTKDAPILFFVDGEISPIGKVDMNKWEIAEFLKKGVLQLRTGGAVVGDILPGLPAYRPIVFNLDVVSRLFMAALVIALVGFAEAISIAKRIATQTRQSLDVNQELLGQGLANCAGSFFQAMPVSGSLTRSAINFDVGAKTGFSSVVAGLLVMIVLLWLTPLFYYLPYATLAVVVIVSVFGLLDLKEMWRVWNVSRNEGLVAVATFILTLVLAPQLAHAVILGMLLSLGVYLYETMSPRFVELVPNQDGYLVELLNGDISNHCRLTSLLRFNGSLYFASAAYFEEKILQLVAEKRKLRYIILDCSRINKLDASGLETLSNICSRLQDAGIKIWFTRVRSQVLAVLKRGGLFEQLGEGLFFKNNELALVELAKHLGEKHMTTCPLTRKI